MELPEDIYAGGPQNPLLRYWLSIDITREMADESLMSPVLAPAGWLISPCIQVFCVLTDERGSIEPRQELNLRSIKIMNDI
jgi:hypothetical protein